MSGFNKIISVQPRAQTSAPSKPTFSSMMPPPSPMNLSARSSSQNSVKQNHQYQNRASTPNARASPAEMARSRATPQQQQRPHDYTRIESAPRKRSLREMHEVEEDYGEDMVMERVTSKKRHFTKADPGEQLSFRGDDEAYEDDEVYPSNQLGVYPLDFNISDAKVTPSEEHLPPNYPNEPMREHEPAHDSPSLLDDVINQPKNGKVAFERVKEDTIEMGGFYLPGSEKKEVLKSYNWIAGRTDGQYRVVLGNNTLFKPKNPVDSKTGERDSNRWRVVRFENRYKENYPYTEFPAKYIETLINALMKAKEQHDRETEDECNAA